MRKEVEVLFVHSGKTFPRDVDAIDGAGPIGSSLVFSAQVSATLVYGTASLWQCTFAGDHLV